MTAVSKHNPFVGRNRTKKYRAAVLIAADELSDEAISSELKISRSTLSEWKRSPEFTAVVSDYQSAIIAEALRLPIAKKHERIKRLNTLEESYWQVIRDRAERYKPAASTPGGSTPAEAATGMLVEKVKIAANGDTVTEWAFDSSLDSAIKGAHKQAAQELGQWEENLIVTHGGTLQQEYVIVEDVPWADSPGDDE